jgi:hypothetical protein
MKNTASQMAMLISAYRRSIVTANEASDKFIIVLAEDPASNPMEFFLQMPQEIQESVMKSVRAFSLNDYRWRPLIIGKPLTEGELDVIQEGTRRVAKSLKSFSEA